MVNLPNMSLCNAAHCQVILQKETAQQERHKRELAEQMQSEADTERGQVQVLQMLHRSYQTALESCHLHLLASTRHLSN